MYKFNSEEIEQLTSRGISIDTANEQLEIFSKGAPYADIIGPATIDNGIIKIYDDTTASYMRTYKKAKSDGRISKFVPASGAATRMFNDLIKAYTNDTGVINESALLTMKNIRNFPFYKDLENIFFSHNKDIDPIINNSNWKKIIELILYEEGLNYSEKPKALLKFTQYNNHSRTALEEHIYEAISLILNKENHVRLHFTFTEKYIPDAIETISELNDQMVGLVFDIDFSSQKPSSDTIAVDMDNNPVKDGNGQLIFRPGGHGALIENLNDFKGDIVIIKNIDNIVHSEHRVVSDEFNKLLCGFLLDIEEKIHNFLISAETCAQDCIEELTFLSSKYLFVDLEKIIKGKTESEKRDFLFEFFNRPIRVCGMIKNTGEPGGGPFFVKNKKGISLQIVESSQIDMNDPEKKALFMSSTHFNPVDIVCSLRDFHGTNFDLRKFIDKDSFFIAQKTYNGKDIKALELPGLWNGAMSDWITAFVEVPLETFCPAKTINDLLKKERYSITR